MTKEEAIEILEMIPRVHEYDYPDNFETAIDMAIEALKKETPNDLIGKPIYRLRVNKISTADEIARGWRKEYHYLVETAEALRRYISFGHTITIEERECNKSDIPRLGKVAFRTREGAEKALDMWNKVLSKETDYDRD